MQKLTGKQKTIFELIREYIEDRKENPTSYKLHKMMATKGFWKFAKIHQHYLRRKPVLHRKKPVHKQE